MTKWTGRLRNLADIQPPEGDDDAEREASSADARSEGEQYLDKVRQKLTQLVEDFAHGRVNRDQFEELYTHYQKERRSVERLISMRPSSDAWRMAVTEGESMMIRRRLAARVLGYAVYVNEDQVALREYGEFDTLDERWVSPLLDGLRRVARETFIAGSVETGGKDAAVLCAVSGEFTTLVVLFSREPARVQLQLLEDLHRHFERANYPILARSLYEKTDLVFPYAAAFE